MTAEGAEECIPAWSCCFTTSNGTRTQHAHVSAMAAAAMMGPWVARNGEREERGEEDREEEREDVEPATGDVRRDF